MKIIKHGNKLVTRRFVCPVCECVFDADYGEYVESNIYGTEFYCNCPECHAAVIDSEKEPEEPQEPEKPNYPELPDNSNDEQENPVF